jgi:D-alanine transaminase
LIGEGAWTPLHLTKDAPMTRIVYVNGRYLAYADAQVHAEDRGFLFGDAVYEVCLVKDGHLVDERGHLDRLARSLQETRIEMPVSRAAIGRIMRECVRRNRVAQGIVYLQISRGASPRDFTFPDPARVKPTLMCLARRSDQARIARNAAKGIAVITRPDERWARVDVKTTQLLAPVLAKQAAREAGAAEAWLVDAAGFVTEGASSNAWIVTRERTLVTRPADFGILRGVTRGVVLKLIASEGLVLEERAFKAAEAHAAAEAFITSASNICTPVVSIDGSRIGNGRPGPVTQRLREIFFTAAEIAR